MIIVISQPMFFPWVGLFEQIKLADIFVYYDDVQFSKGSFVNRVQIKTEDNFKWLTAPVENLKLGQNINETQLNTKKNWKNKHIKFLADTYRGAKFKNEMLELVEQVYADSGHAIGELSIKSMNTVCNYYNIANPDSFLLSSEIKVDGRNTERVLKIVKKLGGTEYITGHGAANYLEHEAFEKEGIEIKYMDYAKTPYPQLYGKFNPYVSILDLLANTGKEGINYIVPKTIPWRDF